MGLTLTPADRRSFRDAHAGQTIYALGSGATLDHIDPAFFADKITVCVNNVGAVYGLQSYYTVTHYHLDAVRNARQRPDLPVIAPEADLGAGGPEEYHGPPITDPNVYFFPTNPQKFGAFDPALHWPDDPEWLVAGPTSLHMTMDFARYLGARWIVLVGADCGLVDGRSNFGGYRVGDNPMPVWADTLPKVADELRRRYGVDVHSLNPWVNYGLEGHAYHSPTCRIN